MQNSIGGEIVESRIKSFHLFRERPFATLPLAQIRTKDRNDLCRLGPSANNISAWRSSQRALIAGGQLWPMHLKVTIQERS